MEPHVFLIFFSVIVLPDGEIKTLSENVVRCPSEEVVLEMHVPKVQSGEIVDWAAACKPITVLLETPTEDSNKLET